MSLIILWTRNILNILETVQLQFSSGSSPQDNSKLGNNYFYLPYTSYTYNVGQNGGDISSFFQVVVNTIVCYETHVKTGMV